MTPLYAAYIASAAGAILFFLSGFLMARRRTPASAGVALAPARTVSPPINPVAPGPVPPGPVAPAPTTGADTGQTASPTYDLGDRDSAVTALRAQVVQLRAALREERARQLDHTAEVRELERLRKDRTALEHEIRQNAALELESARRRARELEQVENENVELRARAGRADELASRVAELEGELREVRARGLAAAPPPPPLAVTPIRPLPRGSDAPRRTSDALSGLLGRMRARKGMRAVALADDLGLPIVGMGDDIASLAAFAGYIEDIGRKSRDFLPLGRISRVTVEDEHDSTVTASSLDAGGSTIALVTLTVGPGPSPRAVGEVLRSAASMIQ